MGVDYQQDHRVLLFHCSITCIYFTGIMLFLHVSENVYKVGTFKFIPVLSTIIIAEIIKLSFTTFRSDYVPVGKLDSSHPSKSKKSLTKTINDSIKFVSAVAGITVIYYIIIVLFGAPLLSLCEETSMLALTLTTLTLIPASLHLGIDNALALFTGSQLPINGVFVDAVKLNVKAVILGTWLSAFVLPLDWDRPWQVWPIPCIVGALLGYFAAHFITILKISTTKFKKKNKKSETLKAC